MGPNHTYSLKEISLWTKEDSSVEIPNIQRGLVWKPSQVELLWDSILRGFPIGSFMLSGAENDKFYLLDGQQRFNAIQVAFGEDVDTNAVLWLDINPQNYPKSTRTFWIKSCTVSHPWGYQNNDECGGLSAQERRDALKQFGLENENIYNAEINLLDTWPFKATTPIPLQYFLKADLESKDTFVDSILDSCSKSQFKFCLRITSDYSKCISTFYDTFLKIREYKVSCNILPQSVIQEESSRSVGEMTSLETLFTRINTGGTRISNEDLNYSAIKAYWPDIYKINDSIAKKYMPSSKLVTLAFKLALIKPEDKGFRNTLSVKQIRQIAKDENERPAVLAIYESLEEILSTIDKWLDVTGYISSTPPILRTGIARNSPDVFLLLMFFAKKEQEGQLINAAFVRGLAFYLHWFTFDKKAQIVNEVMSQCQEEVSEDNILKAISSALGKGLLIPLFSPDEIHNFFIVKGEREWRIWSEDYQRWESFLNRICWYGHSETREMLLYAQREFLNENFKNYDPARQDMWESHNRPWDYDHIAPHNWSANKKGHKYKGYCDHWMWSIGNFAAIPFEKNREKQDKIEYDYYEDHSNQLLFDKRSKSLTHRIIDDKELAFLFAKITWDRTCLIYEKCFDLLKPIFEKVVLTDAQASRKSQFSVIASQFEGCKSFYLANNKEYECTRELDWTSWCISCGVQVNDYYVCVSKIYGANGGKIGLRKLPQHSKKNESISIPNLDENYTIHPDDWWYAVRYIEDMPDDQVINELKRLISLVSNSPEL